MRPVYGRSPWIQQLPKRRVPVFPRLRGHIEAEVVVIGGGLTGCLTAYACAAAGIDVVLLEADRIGQGASGGAAGWITDTPPLSFVASDAALGRRSATHAWQAWRRAALDFQALLRRLGTPCGLDERPTLTIAQTAEQAALLARERAKRTQASLDVSFVPSRAVATLAGCTAAGALRTAQSALIDPYRATLGIASAAAARGARIFERSAVVRTAFTRDGATATAGPTAAVRARRVMVTTTAPGDLFPALARRVSARTAYHVLTAPVPATLRRTLGRRDLLLRDSQEPPHQIAWVDDERVLVGGADSDVVPAGRRSALLIQRTGQLMYELSTIYPDISGLPPAAGWDQQYAVTETGLPVVGPHRNYPHHLFAFGTVGASLTGAYLASRLLLRHQRGANDAKDRSFGFSR